MVVVYYHGRYTSYVVTLQVLRTEAPKQKAALTHHAWQKFQAGALPVGQAEPPVQPARPAKPEVQRLVSSLLLFGTKWLCHFQAAAAASLFRRDLQELL